MITRVHHVGVVVRRLETAYPFWRDDLGLPVVKAAEVPDQGLRAALLACGGAEIELLEPVRPDTGVARFLERRGEGLHHLCLETDDVGPEVARLAALAVELIDRVPRRGLAGLVAFLHPRAGAGTLLELATPPGGPAAPPAPLALEAVTVRVTDVADALRRYAALLARPAPGPAGAPWVDVGGVRLTFQAAAPARPPGLAGISLARGAAARPAGAPPGPGVRTVPPEAAHGVPLVIRSP